MLNSNALLTYGEGNELLLEMNFPENVRDYSSLHVVNPENMFLITTEHEHY